MAMNSDTVALRYAEALFSIGQNTGKLANFQKDAENFLKIFNESKDLRTSLTHPNIRRKQRKSIIDDVLANCSYDQLFANFLRLVVDRGRMGYYPKIVASFIGLRDEADGRLRGVVYSATQLSSSQRGRLKEKLEEKLGHEVIIEERIDESLIGGLRVEVEGRVFDGTVKHHLEKIRESMISSGNR